MTALRIRHRMTVAAIVLVLGFLFACVVFGKANAASLEMKITKNGGIVYGNNFPDGQTSCDDVRISECESGMWTTHFLTKPDGKAADVRLVYDSGLVTFYCDAGYSNILMIASNSMGGKKVDQINALKFYTNARKINFAQVPGKDFIYTNFPRSSQFAQDLPETDLTFSNSKSGPLMAFQWEDVNVRTNYRLHMKTFLHMCAMNQGNNK